MSTRSLQVLRLALSELDWTELVFFWHNVKPLRRYYVGLEVKLGQGSLVIPSKDFFQKICDEGWDFNTFYLDEFVLAFSFMKRDFIGEAIYIARNFPISDTEELLPLALTNGRLAALQILPQEEDLDDILGTVWLSGYLAEVSTELYDTYNLWRKIIPVEGVSLYDDYDRINVWTDGCTKIASFLATILFNRSQVTLDWFAEKVYDYFSRNKQTYGGRVELLERKKDLQKFSAEWGYEPAVALVDFLFKP